MLRLLYLSFILLTSQLLWSQGSALILGNEAYHTIDRLSIKTGIDLPIHTSLKSYDRKDIVNYAVAMDSVRMNLSSLDREDLNYIFRDNNEWLQTTEYSTTIGGKKERFYKKEYTDSTQTFYTIVGNDETDVLGQAAASKASARYFSRDKPILKYFYKTPANFFEIDKEHFQLRMNPIVYFNMGKDSNDEELIFSNIRGIELRGGIDDRIYFYTNIVETQTRFPNYVNRYIEKNNTIPDVGLYKPYESSIFDIKDGYDYLNAYGYIGFNVTKHVGVQFGHGKNFIGNGMRSLLLSDFASRYFYLKLNTRIWKFNYQNIFAEYSALSPGFYDELLPKKYAATHHLSYNITPNLNVGLFEAIVFSRNDQFELQYLNPIILYRSIEHNIGSPDNAFIGLDAKWNFLKRFSLYGQLIFDEFRFTELVTDNNGWWANKYGVQAGLKYIDAFGIDHLDLQVEYNMVRPYTYTHRDSSANYAHFHQALAHPLGANFKEVLFNVRYMPIKKLLIEARIASVQQGEDAEDSNWGGDLLISHNKIMQEYGNEVGQGFLSKTLMGRVNVSYQLFHNMFIDLDYVYRNRDNELDVLDQQTNYIGGGIRVNFAKPRMDF